MNSIIKETDSILLNSTLLANMSEVTAASDKMAKTISQELKFSFPIIVAVMNGGLLPLGLILTKLDFPLETDYIHPTRYNDSTAGGELQWIRKPPESFSGRTILLVDDVLDKGTTLQQTIEECEKIGTKKIYTAVLVSKDVKDRKGLKKTNFSGLTMPDQYLFGCGMDYKRRLRNAPGIFAVSENKR